MNKVNIIYVYKKKQLVTKFSNRTHVQHRRTHHILHVAIYIYATMNNRYMLLSGNAICVHMYLNIHRQQTNYIDCVMICNSLFYKRQLIVIISLSK